MKLHKVLAFNQVDSDLDYFEKGSLEFSNPIAILENFNPSKTIGFVDLIEEEDGIYADLSRFKSKYEDFYPAIGFQKKNSKG